MTYLNTAPITTERDRETSAPQGVYSPLFQAVLNYVLFLLTQYNAPSGKRGPKARAKLVFWLAVMVMLFDGTMSEKRAFLQHVLAQVKDQLDRLHVDYLVWRQRKCWMWGGGYAPGTLAGLPHVLNSRQGALSYAALIPD